MILDVCGQSNPNSHHGGVGRRFLTWRDVGARLGGLGLSGSPMQEADEKCALAGLAAAADQLK